MVLAVKLTMMKYTMKNTKFLSLIRFSISSGSALPSPVTRCVSQDGDYSVEIIFNFTFREVRICNHSA